MANRDPTLWWLAWELPEYCYDTVLSMTKVRDFWIMVTDRSIWKLAVEHDGSPRSQLLQEF